MALTTRLTDLRIAKVGSTALARPLTADIPHEQQTMQSASDAFLGAMAIDPTIIDLRASMQAEDPLVWPTIAALTFPLAIEAHGRQSGASTALKFALAHGVLIGFGITIRDGQPGLLSLDFQNAATVTSGALSQELTYVSGSAPSVSSSRGTSRIAHRLTTFTPDGGSAETLGGIEEISITGRGRVQAEADGGSRFINYVDVFGWDITGSIRFKDFATASSTALAHKLAHLARGTLACQLEMQGKYTEGTAPDDQVMTVERLQFINAPTSMRSQQFASNTLSFNCEMKSALNAALALADIITFESA